MKNIKQLDIAIAALLCAFAAEAGETTVKVSPQGEIASIAAARDKARALRKSGEIRPGERVVVEFAPGEYRIANTVEFGPEDSGIVFRGAGAAQTHIVGGVRITAPATEVYQSGVPFRMKDEAVEKVRVIDLKAAGLEKSMGRETRGLATSARFYADEIPLIPARWPNEGFVHSLHTKKALTFHYTNSIPMDVWMQEPNILANGFWTYTWFANPVKFASIDKWAKEITVEKGAEGERYGMGNGLWFAYNLLCELDAPDESYLDREEAKFYFIPPTQKYSDLWMTETQDLIAIKGAKDVVFEGLSVRYWRNQAVTLEETDGIEFRKCTFACGGRAIVGRNVRRTNVADCDFHEMRSGCISLSGGDPDKLEHAGNFVAGSIFHDFATFRMTYEPAVDLHGCGNGVSKCRIWNGPHAAVIFKGAENEITDNEIHDVCRLSGEMGAIYTGREWNSVGNIIARNHIHDLAQIEAQSWQRTRGVMVDDGGCGMVIVSNRIVRCPGGVSLSSFGNIVADNVFVECGKGVECWRSSMWETPDDFIPTGTKGSRGYTFPKMLDALENLPIDSEAWKTKYPYLALMKATWKNGAARDPATRTAIVRNEFTACGKEVYVIGRRATAGVDEYSTNSWEIASNSTVVGGKRVVWDGAKGVNHTVARIQRTMKAMEESTSENPARINVLFYGQSIVALDWTKFVEQELRRRYPTVKFNFVKKAIGGFESPILRRTAETDVYPEYPDLVFFHDYGPLKFYEEMVAKTKTRTTADVILWSSHVKVGQEPKEMLKIRDERTRGIEAIAKKWGCMYVDLNRKWCEYLIDTDTPVKGMLRDVIHLNDKAFALYAKFILDDIVRIPGLSGDSKDSGTISEIALDDPSVKRLPDGGYEVSFDGNRLVAVSDGTGEASDKVEIFLDGHPVADDAGEFFSTRVTCWPMWMPAICHVDLGDKPVTEDWVLTFIEGTRPDGQVLHYKVRGSKTGEDGEGWSTNDFTSVSGRIKIAKRDWRMPWCIKTKNDQLKGAGKPALEVLPGKELRWAVKPTYDWPYPKKDAGERIVLAQGCVNGSHILRIVPKPDAGLGIAKFIVHKPVACRDIKCAGDDR